MRGSVDRKLLGGGVEVRGFLLNGLSELHTKPGLLTKWAGGTDCREESD